MNQCKHIGNLIGPYLYGDLTTQEAEIVENHLNSCERCRLEVDVRRKVLARLAPQTPTPEERTRILLAVRARTLRADRAVAGAILWPRRAFVAVAAGAVAAALFLGGMWVGGHRAPAPRAQRMIVVAPARSRTPAPVAKQPENRVARADATELVSQRAAAAPRTAVRPRRVRPESSPAVVHAARVVAPVPYGVDDVRLAVVEE